MEGGKLEEETKRGRDLQFVIAGVRMLLVRMKRLF